MVVFFEFWFCERTHQVWYTYTRGSLKVGSSNYRVRYVVHREQERLKAFNTAKTRLLWFYLAFANYAPQHEKISSFSKSLHISGDFWSLTGPLSLEFEFITNRGFRRKLRTSHFRGWSLKAFLVSLLNVFSSATFSWSDKNTSAAFRPCARPSPLPTALQRTSTEKKKNLYPLPTIVFQSNSSLLHSSAQTIRRKYKLRVSIRKFLETRDDARLSMLLSL